jgi:phage baseplate assembly protein W
MAKNIKYSDIDLDFDRHPTTGDLNVLTNSGAIRRALVNLVSLNPLESPFQPYKGSGLRELLFELPHPDTAIELEHRIGLMIQNFEPRVLVSDIEVVAKPDENAYHVTVWYAEINEPDIRNVSLTLNRIK